MTARTPMPEPQDIAVCYGCVHCGCDPSDPDDYCFACEDCEPKVVVMDDDDDF